MENKYAIVAAAKGNDAVIRSLVTIFLDDLFELRFLLRPVDLLMLVFMLMSDIAYALAVVHDGLMCFRHDAFGADS